MEKNKKIEIFVRYVEQLQNIIKYFKKLEDHVCPFLIDIVVKTSKDVITFELVNEPLKYEKLIILLKEYCRAIIENQSKFYKENEFFRLVFDRQLYRLFKITFTFLCLSPSKNSFSFFNSWSFSNILL